MAEIMKEALKKQMIIAEKNIGVIEADIAKAKRIGLDTKSLEKELLSQKGQIKLIKEVYDI